MLRSCDDLFDFIARLNADDVCFPAFALNYSDSPVIAPVGHPFMD